MEDIKTIFGWKLKDLYILIISHREKNIIESLDPLIDDIKKIYIQSTIVNDDIYIYIHERLHIDQKLKR